MSPFGLVANPIVMIFFSVVSISNFIVLNAASRNPSDTGGFSFPDTSSLSETTSQGASAVVQNAGCVPSASVALAVEQSNEGDKSASPETVPGLTLSPRSSPNSNTVFMVSDPTSSEPRPMQPDGGSVPANNIVLSPAIDEKSSASREIAESGKVVGEAGSATDKLPELRPDPVPTPPMDPHGSVPVNNIALPAHESAAYHAKEIPKFQRALLDLGVAAPITLEHCYCLNPLFKSHPSPEALIQVCHVS